MYSYKDRMKKIIAESCFSYEPYSILNLYSMADLSPSCDNCKNFVDSQCTKKLFDGIRNRITMN
jgi:hypothetical protein